MGSLNPEPPYVVAPVPPPPRFSKEQMLEAAAGAVLAAAIITTAGGMSWLVVSLPNRLSTIEQSVARILSNQSRLENRIDTLWSEVRNQDRRIFKLELKR